MDPVELALGSPAWETIKTGSPWPWAKSVRAKLKLSLGGKFHCH